MKSVAKNRLTYAFCFCALVVLFALALFYVPAVPKLPAIADGSGKISTLNIKDLPRDLLDMAELNDGAPLFFYTNFNYGNVRFELPEMRRVSLLKKTEDAKISLVDFEKSILKDVDFSLPEIILSGKQNYISFARLDKNSPEAISANSPKTKAGEVKLEIISLDDFSTVSGRKLQVKSAINGMLWSPLEMTVLVSADGSASAPLITSQSGFEQLDQELENFVLLNVNSFNLRAGFYKFVFAP